MRVTVESTGEIVTVNGVMARVWHGMNADGVPVVVMVSAIGILHPDYTQDLPDVDVPHETLSIKRSDGEELYFRG